MKFSLQLKRLIEKDPLAVMDVILETHLLPELLKNIEPSTRFEDSSSGGKISLIFSKDGEAWVETSSKVEPGNFKPFLRFHGPATEGSGGGQSPYTYAALCLLARGMNKDNEKKPQHRGS